MGCKKGSATNLYMRTKDMSEILTLEERNREREMHLREKRREGGREEDAKQGKRKKRSSTDLHDGEDNPVQHVQSPDRRTCCQRVYTCQQIHAHLRRVKV